jgi:hypothetical protein
MCVLHWNYMIKARSYVWSPFWNISKHLNGRAEERIRRKWKQLERKGEMNYIPSMLIAVQERNKNNSSGIHTHMCSTGILWRDYICTSNYTMYTVIKCLSKHCQNGETKEGGGRESRKNKNGPRADVVCVSAASKRSKRSMQISWWISEQAPGCTFILCTSPNYIPHREKERKRERERPCSSCSNFPRINGPHGLCALSLYSVLI